jgi:uroporphyrin-III C-methyltransferase
LLTLKAAELLRQADVIVYDRLIQEEVLALAKPSAERLYMGKPLGKHDSRQKEIHELLVRKALEGRTVVRLKGGDPFLFGRGGEEAEYLAEHNIPFDVIPGVSSALAAPLSAGIAVTHRDASSAVAIVTGHEARKNESLLDWGALARIETLVFLMGVANAGIIARKLIAHGRNPDTPAAMIQGAYWIHEKVVTGTLATIEELVEKTEAKPPATLVIGKVVAAREKLLKAEWELRRRPDAGAVHDPAPLPDQLLRLATAGMGSQVLYYALTIGLFDRLERAQPVPSLAQELGLNGLALEDILESLAALGLVERTESGYRNLELASTYLVTGSTGSLTPLLLHLAAQSSRESLGRYALEGPMPGLSLEGDEHYFAACESLARLAAPAVTSRLELDGSGPALLAGWGCEEYRAEFLRRWPQLDITALNPFLPPGKDLGEFCNGRSYSVILLSCPLASCRRGQVDQLLRTTANALRRSGLLILHDAFLPGGTLPPPEVALSGLGRRIQRGTCRTWSVERLRDALEPLGFGEIRAEPVTAGMLLVTAGKSER